MPWNSYQFGHALMIASGSKKAFIITEALKRCITAKVTASTLKLQSSKVNFILYKDASAKLTWSIN